MPKISIMLSSYNHEKYIAKAIQSILDQTYQDFELLIYDDGSKDNSHEIIRSFKDERIKSFCYEENRGPFEALQEAWRSTRGEYIAVHHSDDLWVPEKLEKQVKFLDNHPEYAACFTQADFIDENGEEYILPDNHPWKDVFKKENRSREEWLNYFFYYSNCLCHPSVLIRKTAYNECGLLDEKTLFQLPDYLMWIRLCSRKNIYIIQESLVKFRMRRSRPKNVSAPSYTVFVRGANEAYFVGKFFKDLILDDENFLNIFPEGRKYCVNGHLDRDFAFARICLENSTNSPASFQLIGLEILYGLLHDKKRAEKLRALYGYDEKSFVSDMGNYDVFGMEHNLQLLSTQVYFDYGEGFSTEHSIRKKVLIQPDHTFVLQLDCHLERSLKALRFDPDEESVSIRLTQVSINGEEIEHYTSNASEVVGGFYRFLTRDSQYYIGYVKEGNELHIEISGVVEQDWIQKVDNNYKRMASEIAYKDEVLKHQEEVIRNQQEALAYKDKLLQDADKSIADLKKVQSDIMNSTSWKLTAPVRKVGKIMKSRNKK